MRASRWLVALIVAAGCSSSAEPPTSLTPVAGVLGTEAAPRSCDEHATAGTCRELTPEYFADRHLTERGAQGICAAAGGVFLTTRCPTDGTVGHCVAARTDVLYYAAKTGAAGAARDCANVQHGLFTATPEVAPQVAAQEVGDPGGQQPIDETDDDTEPPAHRRRGSSEVIDPWH